LFCLDYRGWSFEYTTDTVVIDHPAVVSGGVLEQTTQMFQLV